MNYDDACTKMNTQTAKCCATCQFWVKLGWLEGRCSVLSRYVKNDDWDSFLPNTMAYTICDRYEEGEHDGPSVTA